MPIDWIIHSIDNFWRIFLVVVVSSDDKNNKEDDKGKNHGKGIFDGKKLKL